VSEECAVWYWRLGEVGYQLYDSEERAATGAFRMMDWEQGAPVCVQYADGRVVLVEDWTAYRNVCDRVLDAERSGRPAAPRPTRTVKAPFGDGRLVEVDADAPAWLGQGA
jgi:hypothetical protein